MICNLLLGYSVCNLEPYVGYVPLPSKLAACITISKNLHHLYWVSLQQSAQICDCLFSKIQGGKMK